MNNNLSFLWFQLYVLVICGVLVYGCAAQASSSQNEFEIFLSNYNQLSPGTASEEIIDIFGNPTTIKVENQADQIWIYHINYQSANPITNTLWYQETVEACDITLYVHFAENLTVIDFSYDASEACTK
ncbi:MAG: hypothetical protein ACE5D7_04865 [Fidelibacterota bacterium]